MQDDPLFNSLPNSQHNQKHFSDCGVFDNNLDEYIYWASLYFVVVYW